MKNDRLQFYVVTSQHGYLYIAFCSHNHESSYRKLRALELSVFPKDHGIETIANVPTIAPAPTAEIVLDDSPEPETLYLIVSRSELSEADPALADAISTRQSVKQTPTCDDKLRRTMGPSTRGATSSAAVSGARMAPRQPKALDPRAPRAPVSEKPTVDTLQRGVEIVFNHGAQTGIDADASGIVVKRFDLKHVPAPRAISTPASRSGRRS